AGIVVGKIGHVWRRRWRRRAKNILHHPLAAQHRRRADWIRRDDQYAALAKQATPARILERYPAKVTAVYIRYAIVPGQPIVHEGVVGIEQIGYRAVITNDAADEHRRFGPECRAHLVVEIGKG